jgi:hypothetical protein
MMGDINEILGQYNEGKRVLQIMPAPVGLVVCEYNSHRRVVTVSPCLGLALVEELDDGLGVSPSVEPIVYHPEGFLLVGGDGRDFYPHGDSKKKERVSVFTLPLREVEGYFTNHPDYPTANVEYWGIPGKDSATA